MALKNKTTEEYLKIDFGYLPLPTIKLFKNDAERQAYDADPSYIKIQSQAYDVPKFATYCADATLNTAGISVADAFKTLAYKALKEKLNTVTSKDESGKTVETTVDTWEDC